MPNIYRTEVHPDWIDHNGHMNVAFYVLAFDKATDATYESWGIGLDYALTSGCSVFTLGINVDYLSELFEGDPIRIETTLVDFDRKRVHYLHQMYNDNTGRLVARNECLCMNVDLESRASSAFPEPVLARLDAAKQPGPAPEGFGRELGIRR